LEKRLTGLDDELAELIRDNPLWSERGELLRSMPGLGKVLSSSLMPCSTTNSLANAYAHLPNFSPLSASGRGF
jgi:hypothetical protein